MDFRISNISKAYEQYNVNSGQKTKKTKAEAQKETFALSSSAKDYQVVNNALSKVPDVREDRIAEITKKIRSGSYKVTADDVAGSILELDSLFDIKR